MLRVTSSVTINKCVYTPWDGRGTAHSDASWRVLPPYRSRLSGGRRRRPRARPSDELPTPASWLRDLAAEFRCGVQPETDCILSVGECGGRGISVSYAPGELWRSRYDGEHDVIVVNSGHRDYVYAARTRALKLRYLVRLFAKEMVRKNFPGAPVDEMLERLIELSLYAEEHLR